MTSRLNPYVQFDGNAREAMEFYRSVLGGELTIATFGDYGQHGTPIETNVMHAQLQTPNGFTLMASDKMPSMPYQPGTNISISLSGDDEEALRGYFKGLSEGGVITMPLDKQAWGDEFGMCTDRFGIGWMVNIGPSQNSA